MKLVNILKIGVGCLCALSISAFALQPAKLPTKAKTTTESHEYLQDSEITAKVKEQFIQQKLFEKANIPVIAIHVKTVNGTVFLTGKVLSQDQANNVIAITKKVRGVKEVKSELEIENKTR